MLDITITRISNTEIPEIFKGVIVALIPNTKKMLNRLLPTTLPIANPGFFFIAATTDVANSGNEVPPATNVNPITDSLIFIARATLLAPDTKRFPPTTSPISPIIINKMHFQSFMFASNSATSSADDEGCLLIAST